jgi:glycerol-3-phosphate dehydrogenase subunit C
MAGCDVPVHGGRGVMVALNHRLTHAVVNRCRMPADGDILVPAHTVSVIGTTDVATDDPDDTSIPVEEVRSCGLMLKREARQILGVDDPDLALVAERVFDICELLRDLLDAGELRTDTRPVRLRVPYHQPCQGRGHGFGKPALDLLRLIPARELIETERECCGVAGTYGLKREKHPVAMAVGASLFADIAEAGADCTACDSETCRWHIAAATGVPAVHPLELLHRAAGLS